MENQTFIDDNVYSNFTITKGITKGIAKKRANQQAIDYAIANQKEIEATNYLQQEMGQGTPRSILLGQPTSNDFEMGQGTPRSIDLGQSISEDYENVLTQPEFSINSAIAVISENDKPALVRMLQRQGSFVTPLSSKKAIIDATLKTIKDNADFRKKLGNYIIEKVEGTDLPNSQSQTDGSLIRIAQGSIPRLGIGRRTKAEANNSNFSSFSDYDDNFANKDGEGKDKLKKLLGTIFSEENITKAVGVGMAYASTRMNANASKGSNQQAIDFEKAQTEKALALAKLEEAKGLASQTTTTTPTDGKGKKKWVMPVAIGGGVLVLGTIIYFVMKKKQ